MKLFETLISSLEVSWNSEYFTADRWLPGVGVAWLQRRQFGLLATTPNQYRLESVFIKSQLFGPIYKDLFDRFFDTELFPLGNKVQL